MDKMKPKKKVRKSGYYWGRLGGRQYNEVVFYDKKNERLIPLNDSPNPNKNTGDAKRSR